MTRYHICNDYTLSKMKDDEIIDESKYDTRPLYGGTIYRERATAEDHYWIVDNPDFDGYQLG